MTHRSRWRTALGVVLTAIMLFPVYWMVNVSFTKTSDMRADPPHWFPWDPTFEGYQAVFRQQLPALGTSLIIGLGTVVLTVLIAALVSLVLALLDHLGVADRVADDDPGVTGEQLQQLQLDVARLVPGEQGVQRAVRPAVHVGDAERDRVQALQL